MADHERHDSEVHGEMSRKLDLLLERVGHPADGGRPATGMYHQVHKLDGRITWFEAKREQFKGGLMTAAVLMAPIGAAIWFLVGGRVSHLFGG